MNEENIPANLRFESSASMCPTFLALFNLVTVFFFAKRKVIFCNVASEASFSLKVYFFQPWATLFNSFGSRLAKQKTKFIVFSPISRHILATKRKIRLTKRFLVVS